MVSLVLLLGATIATHALAAATKGSMSMWSDTKDTIVGFKSDGGACKYADKEMGGLNAPTARNPHIRAREYCAVNTEMFRDGKTCGACFRLTYHGDHPQGLGHPGSHVVQVVDSGSWATFDCHMTAFQAVTGATTHIFPITYEEVPCETSAEGPIAAVLHYDFYFTRFVFGNLQRPLQNVQLSIGEKQFELNQIGGFWSAWTGPADGPVSFTLTEDHGSKVKLSGCFSGWKNRHTGDSCSQATMQNLEAPQNVNSGEVATTPVTSVNLRGASVAAENATAGEAGENVTAAVILP